MSYNLKIAPNQSPLKDRSPFPFSFFQGEGARRADEVERDLGRGFKSKIVHYIVLLT
jgi:hypothetical protein